MLNSGHSPHKHGKYTCSALCWGNRRRTTFEASCELQGWESVPRDWPPKAIVKVVWVLEDGLIKQFVMGIAVGVMKHLWLVVGFLRWLNFMHRWRSVSFYFWISVGWELWVFPEEQTLCEGFLYGNMPWQQDITPSALSLRCNAPMSGHYPL